MASARRDRPQRNRRPPKHYGFDNDEEADDEDEFAAFRPESPLRLPVDTRPAFDVELQKHCAFPSLDLRTHVGLGPSQLYKARRDLREADIVPRMKLYWKWHEERINELKARKVVVGWRDAAPFVSQRAPEIARERAERKAAREKRKAAREKDKEKATARERNKSRSRSRGVSRGASVLHVDNAEKEKEMEEEEREEKEEKEKWDLEEEELRLERVKYEREQEKEFIWPASSSDEEEEEDKVQQRDMEVRSSRLMIVVMNVNHEKQKEAVAEVERVKSLIRNQAGSSGLVGLSRPTSPPPLDSGGSANQTDADGDTVMDGGDPAQVARQLLVSLPTRLLKARVYRREKSPQRPTAAEKGKGREIVPGQVISQSQTTLGLVTQKIASVASIDWASLPANIQYLITYLLTAVQVPPYSFAHTCTLLSLTSDDIISLLHLINHETRKMIVLHYLTNQLAAMRDAEQIIRDLERLKPQGLVTDSVSFEDVRQGQAFLKYMGLNDVAEWLGGYVGVSDSWLDDEGVYLIKVNGKLLAGDIPAETVGRVLHTIQTDEQERLSRANRVDNARGAEAARATYMSPSSPTLGVVNPSVLELPFRGAAANGRAPLTVQEVEQATRRLADMNLLVPEPNNYSVSLNGQCVVLEKGRQAQQIWDEELQNMRQAQRQQEPEAMRRVQKQQQEALQQAQRQRQLPMAPPPRPPTSRLWSLARQQASGQALNQQAAVGRNITGNRGGEQRQEAISRQTSRAQEGMHRDGPRLSRVFQTTPVRQSLPAARADTFDPSPMDIDSAGSSRTISMGPPLSRTMDFPLSTSSRTMNFESNSTMDFEPSSSRTMDTEPSSDRTATYHHDQGQQQRQREQPSSSSHEAVQPAAAIEEESHSPNSATNGYLLSIGIDLSLHRPPQVDTLPGSPTLEQKTSALLEANKATLDAMEQQEIEEEEAQAEAEALRSRQASEARTLRSGSVYSSRFPSEAPSAVSGAASPITTSRPRRTRKARDNPSAGVTPPLPGVTHEQMDRRLEETVSRKEGGSPRQPGVARSQGVQMGRNRGGQNMQNPSRERERETTRQVQVPTEPTSRAPNDTPHRPALGGNGNSRLTPTVATTQKEDARPVAAAAATPSAAPQTPSSSQKKKTKIVLKIGGRRVVSRSNQVTNTPQTEPPVQQSSPPTLGRNFTEPANRYREVSQQPLQQTPRRNLFGTVSQQQQHQNRHQQQVALHPAPLATEMAQGARFVTSQDDSRPVAGRKAQRTKGGRMTKDTGKR